MSAHSIDFSFDNGQKVLDNIQFEFKEGQKICIMGDAASGKSTLMELLTGSLKSFEGNLLVNNIPINNLDMDTYRKHIGVFYHEQDIFQASLYDNICMGNSEVTPDEIMRLADIIGLKDFLSQLPNGLNTILEPAGKGLSTMIAKKILLLRSFVHQPKLLLLDEPFELAGAESSRSINNYLLQLKNCTTVVITGYRAFAEKSDLVIWMDHGRIIHIGSPSDVLTKIPNA